MNVRLSISLIIIGIFISVAGAFWFLETYKVENRKQAFQNLAQAYAQKLKINKERQESTLKALSGFFHASSFVDANEWKKFEVHSNSLSEEESYGYIHFNTESSQSFSEKYGIEKGAEAVVVYSSTESVVGIDTKDRFKGLSEGEIITAPEIFQDNRKVIVWPYNKGSERGCFYLTFYKDTYITEASLRNLKLSIFSTSINSNSELSYKSSFKIGSIDHEFIISPGKGFDPKTNFMAQFTVVSFIGILILLLIIRIQHLNKQKDRELAIRLAHENDILEALNVSTAKYSGGKFFDKLALNLGEVFNSEFCFITEIADDKTLQTLSVFQRKKKVENICYLKAGTPCEKVVNGELVYHPDKIQEIYPDDEFFKECGMNSYLGAPLIAGGGEVLGLLVLLDSKPIKFNDHLEMVLKIFAERCSVEVERKNSYEELLESKKELEKAKNKAIQASKSKSEFLAVMSHEIRTPLNGIVGSLNLLKEVGNLSEEQQDFVDTINFSSDSLMQIINDILDFSKIEAGKMTLESIPFSLKQIMDSIKCIFIPIADEKGLEFLAPEPSNMGNYKGDPGRIRQVIINLVNNALKFTKEGSVIVMTSIKEEGNMAKIRIDVEDTGIGISEENQAKIFESFSQEDSSTTRKFGGTGLGLSISKRLSKMMGGDLSVKSKLGEGSTFTTEIVLEIADENINLAAQSAGKINNFHGTVLLVEDNAVNKKIATKILQKMHLDVQTADNGQEALDMCHSHNYDLIFMDVMMPVMDGLEATSKLRGEGNKTPIVAMTANAFEEDKRKCLDAGMDGFLTKPLKKTEIILELDRFLDAG